MRKWNFPIVESLAPCPLALAPVDKWTVNFIFTGGASAPMPLMPGPQNVSSARCAPPHCDHYNKGPSFANRSSNDDLFVGIFGFVSSKNLQVDVRWMPSHLGEKLAEDPEFKLPEGVSQIDVAMNTIADKLAGEAATVSELPLHITANYLHYYYLVRGIQSRFVCILQSLKNRPYSALDRLKPLHLRFWYLTRMPARLKCPARHRYMTFRLS